MGQHLGSGSKIPYIWILNTHRLRLTSSKSNYLQAGRTAGAWCVTSCSGCLSPSLSSWCTWGWTFRGWSDTSTILSFRYRHIFCPFYGAKSPCYKRCHLIQIFGYSAQSYGTVPLIHFLFAQHLIIRSLPAEICKKLLYSRKYIFTVHEVATR